MENVQSSITAYNCWRTLIQLIGLNNPTVSSALTRLNKEEKQSLVENEGKTKFSCHQINSQRYFGLWTEQNPNSLVFRALL